MATVPLCAAFLVSALLVTRALAATNLEEERLLNYLHSSSSHPMARPAKSAQDAVKVNFGLSTQYLELDEKTETLYGNQWSNYVWNSPYLTWDPANFSDIQSVRVPLGFIWNPDIDVYNSKEESTHGETRVVVYSDGTINYVPRMRTATTCQLDLTYFPFDVQTCLIKLGSWTYDGSKLNLTMRGDDVDTHNYTPNNAWNLVDTHATRSVKLYDCCPEPYIDITFSYTLARRSSYFTYVYVGPVVILSLLGAAIFILPPGNPQKMTLGGTLLICYSLFFLDVSYIMPPIHTSTPLIDKYYMAMYVMLATSIFLAAVATNLAKRMGTHSHPPEIIKKVILGCLGRILCVSTSNYENFDSGNEELSDVKAEGSLSGSTHPSQTNQIREWYLIATVMDRLFLLVYLVLTALLSFSILISYPK